MFGLDDWISGISDGSSLWLVVLAAVLLGLRHATDPDHLAAVTTLVASTRERATRQAARLGLAWGAGHAVTLFAFGVPIVVLGRYLPERVQQGAETAVAIVIVYLAVRMLVRWRRGFFHVHEHAHDGSRHTHVHAHRQATGHGHPHRARTPLGAFAIGLVHGMGGSAGVGVLIVASVSSTPLALLALVLLAAFTAVSMTILSTGFGLTLLSRPARAAFGGLAPALGIASLAFGLWYGSAAWGLAPYPF
jgi:ABC-type nickel/cobalt efflux system permease component RcnA